MSAALGGVLDEAGGLVGDAADDNELTHIVVPDNDNLAYCGLNVTNYAWDEAYHEWEECVVCADLARCDAEVDS